MSSSLSSFIVRENGSINQTATVAAFESQLAAYAVELETESDTLRAAVNATLDQAGERVPMPALVALSVAKLNPQRENYSALETKVKSFIRENSNGAGTGEYRIGKGPKGGCSLVANLSPEDQAKHAADVAKWTK